MSFSKHVQPSEQVGGRRRRAWIGTEMNRTMSRHPDLPGDDDHPLAALHKHGQPLEQVGGRRRRAWRGTEMNRTMPRHPDLAGDDDPPLAALHNTCVLNKGFTRACFLLHPNLSVKMLQNRLESSQNRQNVGRFHLNFKFKI